MLLSGFKLRLANILNHSSSSSLSFISAIKASLAFDGEKAISESSKYLFFCFMVHFQVPGIASGHLMVVILVQLDVHLETGTATLILQPIVVCTLEQFVAHLSRTICSFSFLSFNTLPPSLANSNSICDFGRTLVFHFSAADESGTEKALSSACLSGSIFPALLP